MDSSDIMALIGDNAKFLEEMFKKYKRDKNGLGKEWLRFFEELDNKGISPKAEKELSPFQEFGLNDLLNLFRRQGHLAARLDPLGLVQNNRDLLDAKLEKLTDSDLQKSLACDLGTGRKENSLKDIIDFFEKIYCSTVGIEHYYLVDDGERQWLQGKMEDPQNLKPLAFEVRRQIFKNLYQSDYFEKFLAKKYVGKKRFSLEGSESLIVLLETLIDEAGEGGVQGAVVGMSHRGRLNVLVNVMQKPARLVFAEFEENIDEALDSYSDVKYHLGYSNVLTTRSGNRLKASLAFNPSHLEAVFPVVLGSVRSRQKFFSEGGHFKDSETYARIHHDNYLPLLIHGDASFVGQGVVAESLNLMNLNGYTVGGSIHIVVNNQIGFTTEPGDSRSTLYATDLAKGFQIPIFHVNGDDPEAVYRVGKLAFEYRMRYHKDVIVDLICYRRHGHNEMDEPMYTQPVMYQAIKRHPPTAMIYEKFLLNEPGFPTDEIESIKKEVRDFLEKSFTSAHKDDTRMEVDKFQGVWTDFSNIKEKKYIATGISREVIEKLVNGINGLPGSIRVNNKLLKLFDHRKDMAVGKIPVNWGLAEVLAFGSILLDGYNIRLSGQDSQRGTFSHRHLVLVDIRDGKKWIPLNHISDRQGYIEAINSSLSEVAVLGFEYGYSLADPETMVIWEAQFGDFVNSAQVIIDQFITSSEAKWFRLSGLVLLLPHGYEGQGPEHSSARVERFLQLASDDNIQVCNCTTSAQYFHLLRRQILRRFRKPLIVLSPKSLLRSQEAGSFVDEFTSGGFSHVLDDPDIKNPDRVERVNFCTGKVYYDLKSMQSKTGKNGNKIFSENIALVRIEELYPFPFNDIQAIIEKYSNAGEYFWVQEEPKNQGAWLFVKERIKLLLPENGNLKYIGRVESSSTATGLLKVHLLELEAFLKRALA